MSYSIKKLALSIALIVLSRSGANALTEKPPQIANLADVVAVRNNLLKAIWESRGWPVRNHAALIGTFDPRDPNQASKLEARGIPTQGPVSGAFSRAEALSVTVSIEGHSHETWAYHLLPMAAPNNRLVIVHHGHGDSFASAEYGFNETIARFLRAGYAVLAMYMPNYGPAPRNPSKVPAGDRHNPIFAEHKNSIAALRIFLEPIAACLNYLRAIHGYLDVSMIGLSGGGWTTVLYAALDPTIRLSANISGSLPLDLLSGGYLGDAEQSLGAIYRDVAGYRDLYTLAAYGHGRKHLQILYEKDTCCFSDVQWNRIRPNDHGGLAREINAYQSDIQSKILSGLTGFFSVARFSDNAGQHKISAGALAHVFDVIDNNAPKSSALFLYDSKGRGTRSVLRADGAYQYVGITENLSTDWTDIIAVKNENLFFYRRSDGRAATARLLNDGSYSYVGTVSGVGADWTHVTAAGSRYLFFYNKSNGTAKIGQIDAAGSYSQVGPMLSGFSTQWTHIAGVENGGLFFLDAGAGAGLTARVDASGYKRYAQVSGLATNWTSVTAVNSNALFFYNAPAGTGATALLDEHGNYVPVGPIGGGVPTAASHVAGAKNGALFFLKTSDVTGATWFVDELGGARPVQDLPGLGDWINITGG